MQSAVRMIKVIGAVSLGIGAINTVLGYVLTAGLPWVFTPDRAVWAAVRSVSPLCGLSLGLYGITMAFQVCTVKQQYSAVPYRSQRVRDGGGLFPSMAVYCNTKNACVQ